MSHFGRVPYLLVMVLGIPLVFSCSGPGSSGRTDDELIYAAVLDSVARQAAMIVVADSGPFLPSRARLQTLRAVRPRLPVRALADAEVAPKKGEDDYWTRFEEKYPEAYGWYAVSQIILVDANHATLIYSHYCGRLCGEGGPVELERRGDRWVVTSIRIAWTF